MKRILLLSMLLIGGSFGLQAQTDAAPAVAAKAKVTCCASKAEKAKCADMKVAEASAVEAAQGEEGIAAPKETNATVAKASCCAAMAKNGQDKPCTGKAVAERQEQEPAKEIQ